MAQTASQQLLRLTARVPEGTLGVGHITRNLRFPVEKSSLLFYAQRGRRGLVEVTFFPLQRNMSVTDLLVLLTSYGLAPASPYTLSFLYGQHLEEIPDLVATVWITRDVFVQMCIEKREGVAYALVLEAEAPIDQRVYVACVRK